MSPNACRIDQRLFIDFLRFKFPGLYSLPLKSNLGIKENNHMLYQIQRIKSALSWRVQNRWPFLGIRNTLNLNYIDYDEMFRRRKDFQDTTFQALHYLEYNKIVPWLHLDEMWHDHIKGKKEYGSVFCLLIGLAANLIMNTTHE